MAANRMLAQMRGISAESVKAIDLIHEELEKMIENHVSLGTEESLVLEEIERLEYRLQDLWKFPRDPEKHTWKTRYLFKNNWANTTWRCEETGDVVTIPFEVEETDFFLIGNGYIDVGRWGSYSRRAGNLTKIV